MGAVRGAAFSGFAAALLGAILTPLFITTAAASHLDVDAGVIQYWLLDAPPVSGPASVPAQCGDVDEYDTVIYGTPGDDVLGSNDAADGNHPQLVLGYGGNDTLVGGSQSDCLVGGPGNDRLYGNNAKDVLLGGAGDDYLDGGNAKDDLDGGDGADTCIGGNGNDAVFNCEPASAPVAPEG